MLEIFCREKNGETKLFEFQIPAGQTEDETYPVSYYARFPVKQFTDKTLILRGDLGGLSLTESEMRTYLQRRRNISAMVRVRLSAALRSILHRRPDG